jgi:hypothetical protein
MHRFQMQRCSYIATKPNAAVPLGHISHAASNYSIHMTIARSCKPASETQVEKSKLLIREAIKACEDAGGTAAIPESAYDANGELHIKDIFCCICSGREELQVC